MSRVIPTRSRPMTRSKPNDENAPMQASSSAALRGKPSVGNVADAANKSSAAGTASKALQAVVKTGAKRPALGNISNKDPHVDTEIPMKASKVAGTTRSRSGSLSGEQGKPAKASRTTTTRVPLAATSSTNGAVASRSQPTARPTARLPRTKPAAFTDDDRDMVASATTDDVAMEDGVQRKSSGSGLTPSLGDMLVKQDLSDVPEFAAGVLRPASDMMDEFPEEDEMEDEEDEVDEDDWMALPLELEIKAEEMMRTVREAFVDDVDELDTTMVAEYSEDIFTYMGRLEEQAMANPRYMDHQAEIEWNMRATLVDWLLQVHLRYHMLPETLWIAVNIVDRFLSTRVVSLIKLQLVGVTAMFIAAKYEEILAPSVDEFVYMTESGYTKDEILKGERIILQTLDFDVSSYCSPYSWVRRISKADDYDIQTRTLSKFLMEVTLLDHRFLRAKPSTIAAIGMYVARRMLDGDWNDAFMFYSGLTETQILPGAELLVELLSHPDFEKQYVFKKYSNKKFLRASTFARDWARSHVDEEGAVML